MQGSPQNTKITIQTHWKSGAREPRKSYCRSYLAFVLIAISMIACGYTIATTLFSKAIEKEQEQPHHEYQNSIGVITIEWEEEMEQIRRENYQINIPVLSSSSCQKSEKSMKYQLQQSLINIEIFSLLQTQSTFNTNALSIYFYKIFPLFVLRHPKLTSPSKNSQLSILNFNWWNPFYDDNALKYEGVNKIFHQKNNGSWVSQGNYLTIMSDQPFKPSFIVLEIGEDAQLLKNNLYLYGLLAFDCVITNRQSIEQTLIKKVELKVGRNQIQCDKPECTTEYSMLMFMMEEINVKYIEVYARKKYATSI